MNQGYRPSNPNLAKQDPTMFVAQATNKPKNLSHNKNEILLRFNKDVRGLGYTPHVQLVGPLLIVNDPWQAPKYLPSESCVSCIGTIAATVVSRLNENERMGWVNCGT